MKRAMPTFDASLDAYAREADDLLAGLGKGDEAAEWHVKWMHPRFRDKRVAEVRAAALTMDDARLVVARDYSFDAWVDLERYVEAVGHDRDVLAFETAVELVVAGDAVSLSHALDRDPGLTRARSTRRHRATLLHYIGANGVEQSRQRTPPNAIAVATLLLNAGADPDARAHLYDEPSTTMTMIVSSSHPAAAGLQVALALLLLDRGASLTDPGNTGSAVLTALRFGYLDTARALAGRAPAHDSVIEAAGLGHAEDVERLLPSANTAEKQAALSLAAQLGHVEVVRLLLASGANPDRYNPVGYHAHATPLHQAVWCGQQGVVELLVASGARRDLRDSIYAATPLEWADYGHRTELAAFLRAQEQPHTQG